MVGDGCGGPVEGVGCVVVDLPEGVGRLDGHEGVGPVPVGGGVELLEQEFHAGGLVDDVLAECFGEGEAAGVCDGVGGVVGLVGHPDGVEGSRRGGGEVLGQLFQEGGFDRLGEGCGGLLQGQAYVGQRLGGGVGEPRVAVGKRRLSVAVEVESRFVGVPEGVEFFHDVGVQFLQDGVEEDAVVVDADVDDAGPA